jgi:hypothetical protein
MFNNTIGKLLLVAALTMPFASADVRDRDWGSDFRYRTMPEPMSLAAMGMDFAAVAGLGLLARKKFAKK